MLRSVASPMQNSICRFVFFVLISCVMAQPIQAQKTIEDIGHYTQLGLPVAALGISLVKGDRQGVIQLSKSVFVESVVVFGMKRIINKKRPNGGNHSFPSGHTALSFTSATYLFKRYGWEYGVPATALAAFVGYSRFGTDEPVHYFSDVAAGAALGALTAWIFTSEQIKKHDVSVGASVDSERYVVSVGFRF